MTSNLRPSLVDIYWRDPSEFADVAIDQNIPPDEAGEAWLTLNLAERSHNWNQGIDDIEARWGTNVADALRTGDEAALDAALDSRSSDAAQDVSALFARDLRIAWAQQMELPPDVRTDFIQGDIERVKAWILTHPEHEQPGLFEQVMSASLQATMFGASIQIPGPAREAFLSGNIPEAHRSLPASVSPDVVDAATVWAMETGNPSVVAELEPQFFAIGGHFDNKKIKGDGDEGTTFSLRGDITGKVTLDGGNVNGDLNEVLLDPTATWVAPEGTSHGNSFTIYRLDPEGQVAAEIQLTHIHEHTLADSTTTLIQQPGGFNLLDFALDLVTGVVPIIFPATAPVFSLVRAGRGIIDNASPFDIAGHLLTGIGGRLVTVDANGIRQNTEVLNIGRVVGAVDDIARGDILPAVTQVANVLPDGARSIVQGSATAIGGALNSDPLQVLYGGADIIGGFPDVDLPVEEIKLSVSSASLLDDISQGTFGPNSLISVVGDAVILSRRPGEEPASESTNEEDAALQPIGGQPVQGLTPEVIDQVLQNDPTVLDFAVPEASVEVLTPAQPLETLTPDNIDQILRSDLSNLDLEEPQFSYYNPEPGVGGVAPTLIATNGEIQ
ncbi:MAG: hypothetical protein AAF449_20740, partial [Myxococcota bacterium]